MSPYPENMREDEAERELPSQETAFPPLSRGAYMRVVEDRKHKSFRF
jgi:hypothetical protein